MCVYVYVCACTRTWTYRGSKKQKPPCPYLMGLLQVSKIQPQPASRLGEGVRGVCLERRGLAVKPRLVSNSRSSYLCFQMLELKAHATWLTSCFAFSTSGPLHCLLFSLEYSLRRVSCFCGEVSLGHVLCSSLSSA